MAYHKIDADSINSITSELDFFNIPPTNVSISSAKVFEILPSNPLNDLPLHFKIFSSSNFIDLTKCYLLTEFRVRKEVNGEWVDIEATDNVAPIQMIGSTFIQNLKMSINGREVYNSNSLQAYKSYLAHEFSFTPQAKTSHLTAAGYTYDPEEEKLEEGKGFEARKKRFWGHNEAGNAVPVSAQFIAKLDMDLANQPVLLANFVEIDIEILPADSRFILTWTGPAKYKLDST